MAAKNTNPIVVRINKARVERQRVARNINDFYRLAMPYRQLVGKTAKRTQPNQDDQADIFDNTLQQTVADFAASQIDYFTPDYKPWVKLKAGSNLSDGQARVFNEQKSGFEERLYDLIRETDFYEQQNEIFADLAGGAGGIVIPFAEAAKPVRCQPVLMGSLLFDEGPTNDLDGRWHEFWLKKKDLKIVYPDVDFGSHKTLGSKNDETEIRVVQGVYREWQEEGPPVWRWTIVADDELVLDKTLPKEAPPSLLIARWRNSPPSAWGPGPAEIAMAPARTLDELGYLNLKKLGKEADPPYSYENDGVTNPDGGIDPGVWVARRPGTKEPHPLFVAQNSQNLYFDREALRMVVKKALFEDGPFQRGETPPTATQWLDEKARMQRRQFARRRIYREYVLPALNRFVYVFSRRGELDPIRIDGKIVAAEFVNPLSKASDAEEVSASMQLAQSIIATFGETGLASMDAQETAENWQKKLGDELLKLRNPDDQAGLIQSILKEGRNIVRERT